MGACSSQFPFKRHKVKLGYQHEISSSNEENHTVNNIQLQPKDRSPQAKEASSNDYSQNHFSAEQLISVHDLYNILNDSAIRPFIHDVYSFLVLDARKNEAFSENHIVTAHHHASFLGTAQSREQLSKYSVIVLYGDDVTKDDDASHLEALMRTIREYVACDVLVLKDGFNLFSKRYSYLCTDQGVSSMDDRKLLLCYPSAVVNSTLYQGRGDQARNEVIMTTLGITHVVNISEHSNTFPHKVKYLRLPLDDMVSTNLSQHFHETYKFISDALQNQGRVLIHCNLGISRSSTITLAYLMKSRNWNLLYAFKFLKGIRIAVAPNSGFLRQLSDWEVEIFGEKQTEIDMILKTYGSLKR